MVFGFKVENDAGPLVDDYRRLQWLKEVGYTLPLENLDVFTAEAYVIIGQELQAAREKKRKNGEDNS